ncbi:MAG: LruC domain-containing protein [Bacteroidetes bacterium]|nr:LruC domain-containing protein [Bacteroidota bacterium]
MRKSLIIGLTLTITVLTLSCRKHIDEPDSAIKMENLSVSSSFDWETTHNVEFIITADESKMVRIVSENGKIVYHQGFYSTMPAPYNIKLNLPKIVTKVMVNDRLTDITSNTVSVQLIDSQQKNSRFFELTNVPEPVVYWKLNESQGNIASDAMGLLEGTATGHRWVAGINGNAIEFDGVTGHVRINNSGAFNPVNDQISFAFWFKLNTVGSSGTFLFHNTKYILKIDPQGRLTFALYIPTYKDAVMAYSDRILDTDWHHMIGTYDGNVMKLYLDGQLMASKIVSGNLNPSNAPILIGNQNTINFFNGQMDEVQIYGSALTEVAINELYMSSQNPGSGEENLISYWSLNENQGLIAYDQTGSNNGTISNASWVPGISGSCLSFNGTNSHVNIPNHPSLNPVTSISMMAWVKTTTNLTTKIVQKGDWDGHGLGQGKWDGWNAHIRTADNMSHSLHWLGGLPVINEWYHLAMTYDGSMFKFYVNGQLRNSKALTGELKVNGRNASIGSDNAAQKFFTGEIDEVKIFGSALSQTEIQSNYSTTGQSNDQDGDGVADQDDDFPNDPARAFINYFPAEGYGSLAFEDLWPNKGDYDFNDLVVDYRFKIVTNARNKVSDVIGDFVIKAIGAGFENGFGFQFDGNTVSQEDILVEGHILSEDYVQLNQNGTEAGQEELTIIVFDNANKILVPTTGFGVNVFPDQPYIEPDTVRLNIGFKTDKYLINDLSIHNFNPFIIINKERGKEVHLPNRKPTSLAAAEFFGQGQDDSNPSTGKYYKTAENLPWALNISSSYDHTIESFQITSAHLKFAAWAESSGVQFPDWFLDLAGYRDKSKIYKSPK